jgi:hypothetical protein
MPRLLQSTLLPGNATQWLEAIQTQTRVSVLSSVHPTLLVGLEERSGRWFVRHELVFGLFRTVWTSAATLDRERGRLVCKGADRHFESIEQILCWEQGERGLSIQSELSWSGAKTALEDLLLRSLLRFPNCEAAAASERTTQRLAMDGQAAA